MVAGGEMVLCGGGGGGSRLVPGITSIDFSGQVVGDPRILRPWFGRPGWPTPSDQPFFGQTGN